MGIWGRGNRKVRSTGRVGRTVTQAGIYSSLDFRSERLAWVELFFLKKEGPEGVSYRDFLYPPGGPRAKAIRSQAWGEVLGVQGSLFRFWFENARIPSASLTPPPWPSSVAPAFPHAPLSQLGPAHSGALDRSRQLPQCRLGSSVHTAPGLPPGSQSWLS